MQNVIYVRMFLYLQQKTRDFHVTSALYNHDGTEILASYAADKIYLFDNTVNGTNEYLHSYMGHR